MEITIQERPRPGSVVGALWSYSSPYEASLTRLQLVKRKIEGTRYEGGFMVCTANNKAMIVAGSEQWVLREEGEFADWSSLLDRLDQKYALIKADGEIYWEGRTDGDGFYYGEEDEEEDAPAGIPRRAVDGKPDPKSLEAEARWQAEETPEWAMRHRDD